jgi:hypothetical protein
MAFFPDLIDKLRGFAAAFAGFLKGLPEKLPTLFKNRNVVIGLGVFFVILLLGIIMGLAGANRMASKRDKAGIESEGSSSFQKIAIPVEELFLPEEPDFLPGVLLEREKRKTWTASDAGQYWQDPMKYGEEQWRDRVESAIDDLLERVP